MKITAISDLHGNLIDIAPCDVLLICGDISPLEIQRDHIQMTKWVFGELMDWVKKLPCDKIFFTPGNHDFWFEKFCNENMRNIFKYGKFEILMDEARTYFLKTSHEENLEKVTVYGTPWIKPIGREGTWAFEKNPTELTKIYDKIPNNVDILITHDAPALGYVGIEVSGRDVMDFSNSALAEAIKNKKPKYAICGHVHEGKHKFEYIEVSDKDSPDIITTSVANCSILDDSYSIKYEPLTFEL